MLLISLLFACRGEAGPTTLVLNELVPDNNNAYEEPDGDEPDWLELYNSGDHTLYLKGWTLGEPGDDLFGLPDVELGAGELLLIGMGEEADEPAIPQTLSSGGGELALYDPEGVPQDWTAWDTIGEDIAWRRPVDGGLPWETGEPSPGESNP